jgi:hypothetical protein
MAVPTGRAWIGASWVPVVQEVELSHFGEYRSFPKPQIAIGPVRGEIAALTAIHETFEAISDIYDLNLKETQIRCIEHAVAGLIVRSPELVDWAISELRKAENSCPMSTPFVD